MATAMPGLGATLLTAVTTVVEDAGATLRERYTPHARGVSLKEVVEETCANDDAEHPRVRGGSPVWPGSTGSPSSVGPADAGVCRTTPPAPGRSGGGTRRRGDVPPAQERGPEPCLVNDVLGTSSWYWALPVLSRAIPEAVRRVAYVLDEHEQAERERW